MTKIRVIDFETSGEEPPAAMVCEVGYTDFHLESGSFDGPHSWLCEVPEMPPEVRAVHHISLDEVRGAPEFDPDKLYQGSPDAFVAHNSSYETKFFAPEIPVICTYKAALRVWPDAPSHGNNAIRYWLEDRGLIAPIHEKTLPTHRAGPDSYVTAHILKALFDAGNTGQVMELWTREHAVLPRCPIGQFRGKPWSEVEMGFLQWMTRQPNMEDELKWNARREIDARTNPAGLDRRQENGSESI